MAEGALGRKGEGRCHIPLTVFSSNMHKANAHYTHPNVQILHAP